MQRNPLSICQFVGFEIAVSTTRTHHGYTDIQRALCLMPLSEWYPTCASMYMMARTVLSMT